jgi:glycine/D-amino acid oxidase-like deaminating enzyme
MIDYIIVGQGLAGSILAWKLIEVGQSVLVINNSATNQASHIAAGIYNPITGRNLVKTWLADQIFPALVAFYTHMEAALSIRILYPTPIWRPFVSEQEKIDYHIRMKATGDQHMHTFFNKPLEEKMLAAPHGGAVIQQAGYVDLPVFLKAMRAYLQARGSYMETDFHYQDVTLTDTVSYQHISAKKLIFCEGSQAVNNPFFKQLPFRLVKGELLTVQLPQPIDHIYARSGFVVPRPHGQAVLGATYHWDTLDTLPTALAKEEIEEKVSKFFLLPYQLISQQAGIRPATFDRRPFIGSHPTYPQVAILNGLGSKGVSLAPYLVDEFVQHLLYGKALHPEVRLDRYQKDV